MVFGDILVSQIKTFVADIKFPVDKQELIDKLREKGVPEAVMQKVEEFADKEYKDEDEVVEEMRKVE